jgi:tRNA modification GTPase
MIEAKSSQAIKILSKQLQGDLKTFVDDIRDDLVMMLAHTEVNIDYAEDDLPSDIISNIYTKLDDIVELLYDTLSISRRREGLIDGFKISIIGKPNVGKSSLLNRLLSYERAIVSDIAGTTRDTIEESIKIGTHLIKIVDTAGIRNTQDSIESIGITRSKNAIESSDIIVALFDNSSRFDGDDKDILAMLQDTDKIKILVLNKIDLESKFDGDIKFDIKISSKSDITPLIEHITDILNQNVSEDTITLISKRQINIIKESLDQLIGAKEFLETMELELFAYHIQEAIKYISQITYPYDNEEMLDKMFNQFCLGK